MTETKYQSISCHYYDELEAVATRKVICHLHYRDAEGRATCIQTKLVDFVTIKKEEFLITEDNLQIRLDHIISVNDLLPDDADYC